MIEADPYSHVKRHGFTLIELLVVISIISLLISILLPSLQRARDAARSITCAGNIRQWSMASFAYATDYGGLGPNTIKSIQHGDDSLGQSQKAASYYAGPLFNGGYIAGGNISEALLTDLSCPVYVSDRGVYDWLIRDDGTIEPSYPQWFSYTYGMTHTEGGPGQSTLGDFDETVFDLQDVSEPAGFMFMGETHITGSHEQRALYARRSYIGDYGGWVGVHNSWHHHETPVGPEPHNGALNVLLYDGHLETLPYQTVREKRLHVIGP